MTAQTDDSSDRCQIKQMADDSSDISVDGTLDSIQEFGQSAKYSRFTFILEPSLKCLYLYAWVPLTKFRVVY